MTAGGEGALLADSTSAPKSFQPSLSGDRALLADSTSAPKSFQPSLSSEGEGWKLSPRLEGLSFPPSGSRVPAWSRAGTGSGSARESPAAAPPAPTIDGRRGGNFGKIRANFAYFLVSVAIHQCIWMCTRHQCWGHIWCGPTCIWHCCFALLACTAASATQSASTSTDAAGAGAAKR